MSKKIKQESKKARKKRCRDSYSKVHGANLIKNRSKTKPRRMPETFEEAVSMEILK